jgi:hypothetical protein
MLSSVPPVASVALSGENASLNIPGEKSVIAAR